MKSEHLFKQEKAREWKVLPFTILTILTIFNITIETCLLGIPKTSDTQVQLVTVLKCLQSAARATREESEIRSCYYPEWEMDICPCVRFHVES